VFLGLPPSHESEGYDREHMNLPRQQIDLLEAVAAANPNVIVVLSNGAAVTVADWQHKARAVLECWLLGQAGGAAVADLLLGAVSPSGKLAETIPVRLADNPTVGNFPRENGSVRYGEGLLLGYRWYDAHRLEVSHPFGHGLSYTSFAYRDLDLQVLADGAAPRVRVAFTISNAGDRAGIEIAQVYVADPARPSTGPSRSCAASPASSLSQVHRSASRWSWAPGPSPTGMRPSATGPSRAGSSRCVLGPLAGIYA